MSAAGVPASERLDWFTDVIAQELVPTAIRSERVRDFWAEASVLDLGFRHRAVREALARKINEPCAHGTSGGLARP
ncbi:MULTISPECIES: hypothetical protein [unclassified Streptomyces]|uniref:hypothetical protein n=1 Tax=unclassified Streptomyces TaxID=2593676 RepID=UPI00331ECD9F